MILFKFCTLSEVKKGGGAGNKAPKEALEHDTASFTEEKNGKETHHLQGRQKSDDFEKY